MKQRISTNPHMRDLIQELKKKGTEQSAPLWKRVASDLERSTRSRRVVNLSSLSKYTQENDTIVVPGKVLGSGELAHKLTIAAFKFSDSALEKIEKAGAKVIPLTELSKESPKGKKIRVLG
jgi:large subunit ribosomal protein L18e